MKNTSEKSYRPVLFLVQFQYENQLNILSSLEIGGFIIEHLYILLITHITQRVCIYPLKLASPVDIIKIMCIINKYTQTSHV